jgi:hypothetical protein
MSENKKAASGAGNTTDSKANQPMASVAQQGSKVKQRIMLLLEEEEVKKNAVHSG